MDGKSESLANHVCFNGHDTTTNMQSSVNGHQLITLLVGSDVKFKSYALPPTLVFQGDGSGLVKLTIFAFF